MELEVDNARYMPPLEGTGDGWPCVKTKRKFKSNYQKRLFS